WCPSVASGVPPSLGRSCTAYTEESGVLCGLLRELFGPVPHRGGPLDRSLLEWGGGTMRGLAQAAYDDRSMPAGLLANSRLGSLAAALEGGGCADEAMLSPLREPGSHVRGCWVVDLILGKA